MNKKVMALVLLLALSSVFIAACVKESPEPAPLTEQELVDLENSMDDFDSLETELDFGSLDTLDEDLDFG